MSTTTNPLGLKSEPPLNEAPHDGLGMPTQAWASWFLDASDRLNKLQIGVTDGSEAKAGNVGEYLSGTGGPVALTSGSVASVASLSLTAGDWDVSGSVRIAATAGTFTGFGAGTGAGQIDTFFTAVIPGGTATNQFFNTSTKRYNVTAATTVWVTGLAFFSAGTANASGDIRARRIR